MNLFSKKAKIVLLITAVLMGATFTCHAQYDLDYFYYHGRQDLIDGRYAQSIENFNILAQLDTACYEAYFFRGIAKYNLGDFNGAQRDFDRTLHFNPIYTPAYHYRAITLSRTGRFEQALKDLEEAVDLRPNYTGLYFSRGVTYFLSQQFDKAVKDFNVFIRRQPKESDAYLNRGACYLYLGDTTKAMNDYNQAIVLNRLDPEGYVRRSRLFAMQSKVDSALVDLDYAINLDKDNTFAYFNRALLKYEKKDIEGALKDLENVLEEEPGNALTLYNRALIYAQVGEYTKALDDYDRVLNINPNNVLAYFNRAAVFMELGRYRQAVADYSMAIDLYPDFAKAYMNRSYAKQRLGQFKSSKQDYDIAQQKISEYKATAGDSTAYAAFADTTKKYDHLLALDADFAKKDFNNELLQYRDVDIRLKPLFKFTPSDTTVVNYALSRRFEDSVLDHFISESPLAIKFGAEAKGNVKESSKSRAYLNESLEKQRSSKILFLKALYDTYAKQYNSALACYDEAIHLDPENPFYYLNRGSLNAEMIEFISSIENNVQVLTLDNDRTLKTRVQDQVSKTYDYSAAIHDMMKAASFKPDFPFIYYNLGNLYCLSKDLPEAISQYNKAIEMYPAMAEAYYNRGLVLIYLKDKEKGCIDLSTAGELGIQDAYSVINKYCKKDKEQ